MAERGVTVLVADDVQAHRESLCRALRLYGYRCEPVDGVEGAMSWMAAGREPAVDIVVAGIAEPAGLGSKVVRALLGAGGTVPVVAIRGVRATPEAEALRARGVRTISTPFDPETLCRAVAEALDRNGKETKR
jgi:DNA-binding NtrC family response regulator